MNEQTEVAGETLDSVSPASCTVSEQWTEGIAVVSVTGVVDMLTAPALDEAIRGAVGKNPTALVVDFTAVDFLASAGMGVLVGVHDEITPGISFRVVADGPATSRPLKLVGIADIIPLHSTLDEAMAALHA